MRKIGICSIGFGLAAAVAFFASVADFAYPGESASWMAQLKGLADATSVTAHPFFRVVAKLCGGSNFLAPILGTIGCASLFAIVAIFVYTRVVVDKIKPNRERFALIAAGIATFVFALTPAVHSASTHLEPRLFDLVWMLGGFVIILPFALRNHSPLRMLALVLGIWCALGAIDSVLLSLTVPAYALAMWRLARGRRRYRPLGITLLFLALAFVSLLMTFWVFQITPGDWLLASRREFLSWCVPKGWVFVLIFATLPLFFAIMAAGRSFNGEGGKPQKFTHLGLSIAVVLSIATPFSPSALMRSYGILPVFSSAAAAVTAGYLVAYWWMRRRSVVAVVAGCALAFVFAVSAICNLFAFDGSAGSFADRIAERVIDGLGNRRWLVTDGVLDNHLRLQASKRGLAINLVSLNRDLDTGYLDELVTLVEREKLGGEKNTMLRLSAKLGVLPFLNDWFACDDSVKTNVAVWGAPDLWYSAGITPVPELLFFGADEKIVPDWGAWKELDSILEVPKGWGSYRYRKQTDPVARLRQSLRRHVGLVANDRGVYLQDRGDNDAAWKMYELVLNEIDHDNICAIFNEVAMIGAKQPSAVAKRQSLERMLKAAVDDPKRRYLLWRLSSYYGYIRDVGVFIKLGHGWARSGRPGEAIAQIRRAIDIVPDDRRDSLMNLLAALYASENDREESRRLWADALKRNANDHDALVGMMRIEITEGNVEEAQRYLERASKSVADGRQAKIDRAMLAIMRNDSVTAEQLLHKLVDENAKDLQAWSLLAATVIHQIDTAKDEAVKLKLSQRLEKTILPAMQSAGASDDDYYVQAVKGFILLRQGQKKRKEARDAFVAAAKARPDVTATQEMVIGMDISLADPVSAEAHARQILRRNRNAPLANYAMGSIELGKGNLDEAETYLRRAVDAPQPTPLAQNDLAELLRRTKRYDEAEFYARKAVKSAPKLPAAWDTLGAVLLDAGKNLEEAESAINRACELSKTKSGTEGDVRMLVSLARLQLKRGDKLHARVTIRKIKSRINELNEFERKEFEEFSNGAK